MARVTSPSVPHALKALLPPELSVRRASALRSASVSLTPRPVSPGGLLKPTSRLLSLSDLAQNYTQHRWDHFGSATGQPSLQDVREDLAERRFAPEFWTALPLALERLLIAYPDHGRSSSNDGLYSDPEIPVPSSIDYDEFNEVRSYSTDPDAAAEDRAGWWTAIDSAGRIHEERVGVRLKVMECTVADQLPQRFPVALRILGSIRAEASTRGARSWFAPVYAFERSRYLWSDWTRLRVPAYADPYLVRRRLEIPPPSQSWSHVQNIDLVLNASRALSQRRRTLDRYNIIPLGAFPPHGRFTAGNQWIQCQSDLDLQLFIPSYLMP